MITSTKFTVSTTNDNITLQLGFWGDADFKLGVILKIAFMMYRFHLHQC